MRYDRNCLEQITFLTFVRVMKERNMYIRFLANVDKQHSGLLFFTPYCETIRYMLSNQFGAFRMCASVGDILHNLEKMAHNILGQYSSHVTKVDSAESIQEYVMACTNILVHEFIEPCGFDFGFVSTVGEEIFTKSCKVVFGDDFVDMTKKPDSMDLTPEQAKVIGRGANTMRPISQEALEFIRMNQIRYVRDDFGAYITTNNTTPIFTTTTYTL